MKWTVMQLKKFQGETIELNDTVDVAEELLSRDQEIRGASPIQVKGTVSVDNDKATFHLRLLGTLILPCSRTLQDVHYDIDTTSIETFLLEPWKYENEDDVDLNEPQAGVVDLTPIIIELLLLEVPIQVFCDDDPDDGLLQSGNDWLVMTEDEFLKRKQNEKKIDPRLAGLADFFKDEKS